MNKSSLISLLLDCNSKDLDDDNVSRILDVFTAHHSDNLLRLISLRDNRLTKVPPQIRFFSKLNRLNLGYNRLSSIKVGDFNFSSTEFNRQNVRLWLNHNEIRFIEPGALAGIFISKRIIQNNSIKLNCILCRNLWPRF